MYIKKYKMYIKKYNFKCLICKKEKKSIFINKTTCNKCKALRKAGRGQKKLI